PDGFDWVDTMTVTINSGGSHSVSHTDTVTETNAVTHQLHDAESIQQMVSLALSAQESEGDSLTHAEGDSEALMRGNSRTDSSAQAEQTSSSLSTSRAD